MEGVVDGLMVAFGIAAIALDFFIGVVLARRISTIKETSKRKYYLSMAGFFFLHGTFVLTYVIYQSTSMGTLFNFGVLLALAGVVLLVYAIELTVYVQSRYFFTIFGAVAVAIIAVDQFTRIMILGIRLMEWPQYFANPLLVLFIVYVYISAFRKASGPARRNALFMVIGIISFMLAELTLSNAVKVLIPGSVYVGPPLRVIAIILLAYGILHLTIWKEGNQNQMKIDDKV